MIDVKFSNSNKIYKLPESWDDLETKDLINFIRIIHTTEDIHLAKLKILKEFMGLPNYFFNNKDEFFADEISGKLIGIVDLFLNDEPFSKNIIKSFSHEGTLYIGPTDMYENMSAEELDMADYYYNLYVDTEEVKYLHHFVACIYREKDIQSIPGTDNFKGDLRVSFNVNNIGYIANRFNTLDIYLCHAIMFNYRNIMRWYSTMEEWKLVFSSTSNSSSATWSKVFRSIAGDKLGTIDSIKRMAIYQIFDELQYLEEQRLINKP